MTLLPDILDDMHKGDMIADEHVAEDIWAALKDQAWLWRRGDPMSFAKFMSSQHKKRDFLQRWTITLFQLLYWGLLCGNIDRDSFRDLAQKKTMVFWQKLEPDGEGQAAPLAQGRKEQDAKLRHICKSGYHTATLLLSDTDNKIRQRVLYCIGEPLTSWFTNMSSRMRSSGGSRSFLAECVAGGGLNAVLYQTINLLVDVDRIAFCVMLVGVGVSADIQNAAHPPSLGER